MCADVIKVNGVRFFVLIFKISLFRTTEYCKNGKVDTFMRSIDNIQRLAARHGFRVVQFDMDEKLESLQTRTANVLINTVLREEHMPETERNIRTVKDRTRSTLSSLTFQRIKNRILIELAFGQVFCLDTFPNNYGLSSTLSPHTFITGKYIDHIKH